jgi:hypothetical protein
MIGRSKLAMVVILIVDNRRLAESSQTQCQVLDKCFRLCFGKGPVDQAIGLGYAAVMKDVIARYKFQCPQATNQSWHPFHCPAARHNA